MVVVCGLLGMFDIPVPQIRKREVLFRVRAAGTCHYDAHCRAGISPVRPLAMI